jgi:MFS family permease
VSLSTAVYFLLSYPAGILVDHSNRKALLGIGLIGNGLAFVLMALTHQYWLLLVWAVVAGLFGSVYHPGANALIPAHYPKSPGMAVGILGIGSGIGFFVGSQYAGMRAETVGSSWWGMSNWQAPCAELGMAGIVGGLLFLMLASEVPHSPAHRRGQPLGKGMRRRMLGITAILGWRDFAGGASMSLLSIYFQKAHGYDARQTGLVLGLMGLMSIFATPLCVWLTGGRRRLSGFVLILIGGGLTQMLIPHVPIAWLLAVLSIFQVFHLGSYAVGEVAMVELAGPAVRGRAIGLYLTVCGTLGAVAPWVMGWWTDLLGPRAHEQSGYIIPFTVLGALTLFSTLAVPLMKRLGNMQQQPTLDAMLAAAADPSL